ncbi:MAG TPA: phospholipid carrier-dependent glycosyltransferase [Solirubrobacteraceae bacterium]|jgi:predicted membrane-bound dolichyl-phosphate-mannose-protein mannosyltransferase
MLSAIRRAWATSRRLLADPLAPTVVLSLILVLSLYARVLHLGQPCTSPCKAKNVHTLIFDENYYVNAARVIDHIEPPAGAPYHGAPLGDDPNAEHPQLAKLAIAAGIEIFGDNARGWRIGSVLFALIGMVALYAMVRAAGGGAWLAVGAVGVMALDNLLLVHGRIATLDIYAVSMMLVAMAFYLRGWWLPAGIALGVAGCMKEVALLLVVVVVLLEALRWVQGKRNLRKLALFLLTGALSLLGLLWLLDVLVPGYDPVNHVTYAGSPFTHLFHMYHYAQLLKAKPNETGIASSPWQWLLDERAIDYAKVAVNSLANGHIVASRATVYFRGVINPFIIFLAIPALFAAVAAAWRKGDGVAALGACWCLGTFLPMALESLLSGRISYLYYMVIVLPGVYLVTARLFRPSRIGPAATLGWVTALLYSFLHLYPLRTLR